MNDLQHTDVVQNGVSKYLLTLPEFQPNNIINQKLAVRLSEYLEENIDIPDGMETNITFRALYTTMTIDIMQKIDKLNARERDSSIKELIYEYYDALDKEYAAHEIVLQPNCDRTCPKCHNKTVYMEYKQKRAIDEAVTVYYKCLTCSYGF